MRHLFVAVVGGAMALLAHNAGAADDKMTIAVFTKNSTNPAYEAFRIAADQIARTTGAKLVHFVPKQPDNVDEQKAMVDQVINGEAGCGDLHSRRRCRDGPFGEAAQRG